MSSIRYNKREVGQVGTPYLPSFKRIAPAVIAGLGAGGAVVSGLGSLVSGIGSIFNGRSTNKTNERMQRETNDLNYQIHQEQLAAARKQYEDEVAENRFLTQQARDWQLADTQSDREYNSAKAQVQRFREAGLNPALAMYGGAGSVASQSSPPPQGSNPSGSVPDAPQMVAPRNNPLPFGQLGAGISEAFSQYLNHSKISSDITLERASTFSNVIKTIDSLSGIDKDTKNDYLNKVLKSFGFDSGKGFSFDTSSLAHQTAEQIFEGFKNDNAVKIFNLNMMSEMSAEQRKVWERDAVRFNNELKEFDARMQQYADDHKLSEMNLNMVERLFEQLKHEDERWKRLDDFLGAHGMLRMFFNSALSTFQSFAPLFMRGVR